MRSIFFLAVFLFISNNSFAEVYLQELHCVSKGGTKIDYTFDSDQTGPVSVSIGNYEDKGRLNSAWKEYGKYKIDIILTDDRAVRYGHEITINSTPSIGRCELVNSLRQYYQIKKITGDPFFGPPENLRCALRTMSSGAEELARDEGRYVEPKPCRLP
jgi:hypothetical protein